MPKKMGSFTEDHKWNIGIGGKNLFEMFFHIFFIISNFVRLKKPAAAAASLIQYQKIRWKIIRKKYDLLQLSVSLSHTHIHTHYIFLSFPISYSHVHTTHTHTLFLSRSLSQSPEVLSSSDFVQRKNVGDVKNEKKDIEILKIRERHLLRSPFSFLL